MMEPWDGYPDLAEVPEDAVPGPELTLFIKERKRGPGYVADFLYKAADLPVAVHGILANQGSGIGVVELELWRPEGATGTTGETSSAPRRGSRYGDARADHQ
ncbi:hypothetical protein AB0M97_26570 [Streptomyces sp. NPDC051207]|uniref:hypothetical protein n=1 Tax=Streptomyces sp. NPDC051207 TaxID=3154641 RepID=UPI00342080AD